MESKATITITQTGQRPTSKAPLSSPQVGAGTGAESGEIARRRRPTARRETARDSARANGRRVWRRGAAAAQSAAAAAAAGPPAAVAAQWVGEPPVAAAQSCAAPAAVAPPRTPAVAHAARSSAAPPLVPPAGESWLPKTCGASGVRWPFSVVAHREGRSGKRGSCRVQ